MPCHKAWQNSTLCGVRNGIVLACFNIPWPVVGVCWSSIAWSCTIDCCNPIVRTGQHRHYTHWITFFAATCGVDQWRTEISQAPAPVQRLRGSTVPNRSGGLLNGSKFGGELHALWRKSIEHSETAFRLPIASSSSHVSSWSQKQIFLAKNQLPEREIVKTCNWWYFWPTLEPKSIKPWLAEPNWLWECRLFWELREFSPAWASRGSHLHRLRRCSSSLPQLRQKWVGGCWHMNGGLPLSFCSSPWAKMATDCWSSQKGRAIEGVSNHLSDNTNLFLNNVWPSTSTRLDSECFADAMLLILQTMAVSSDTAYQ